MASVAGESPLSDRPLYERTLDDGRILAVYQMLFTTRICIGPNDGLTYEDGWCYPNTDRALHCAEIWDGEGDPGVGWIKQISTGRRRSDGPGGFHGRGDPDKEYVMR